MRESVAAEKAVVYPADAALHDCHLLENAARAKGRASFVLLVFLLGLLLGFFLPMLDPGPGYLHIFLVHLYAYEVEAL